MARREGCGRLRWIVTSKSVGARTKLTLPNHEPRGLVRSRLRALLVRRLKVHSTSLDVNGMPSCHFTPRRSLNDSSVLSSFQAQDSARSGTTASSLFCATAGSNITRLLKSGMKATTVEALVSSRIDALAGLSRWKMRSTPPVRWASATSHQPSSRARDPMSSLVRIFKSLHATPDSPATALSLG